ncbi:MAG: DNA cytosine methyltransferase, partial [Moraxellaceae bacterium]|nr:DNA cytosine methyltransferase [Moraxellaceae bacterium]
YPDDFRIPVSDTRAYQQFGNSVVMLAFQEVARIMQPYLVPFEHHVVQPDLLAEAV